jgi:hypothetical protein
MPINCRIDYLVSFGFKETTTCSRNSSSIFPEVLYVFDQMKQLLDNEENYKPVLVQINAFPSDKQIKFPV